MDQNEIGLKINVDNKSLNDLNNQLKDLTEKWKSVETGSEEFKKLDKQILLVNKSIKNAGAEIDNTGSLVSKLQGNIFSLVPGLGTLKNGFAALNTTFLEIVENPVLGAFVAISAVLIALYEAFSNTKQGAKELKILFSEFGEISYQIKDILSDIATVIAAVLIPIIKTFVESLSSMLEYVGNNKTMFFELGAVIGITTLILNANAIATSALALVQGTISTATYVWAAAQMALNIVMEANPVGLVIAAIAALVAIVVIAYNKSEIFRGIVEGVILVFKTWIQTSKDVVDILGGIGKAIMGIITLDPDKIKEGIDQASDAGIRIGKRYQEGFKKGVDIIKAGEKEGDGTSAAKKMEDIKTKELNLTKEGNALLVRKKELESNIAEVREKSAAGDKDALKQLKKVEEQQKKVNDDVLANKKAIYENLKDKAALDSKEPGLLKEAQDAEIAYFDAKKENSQELLKLDRIGKKESIKSKKEETTAQKKLREETDKSLLKLKNDYKEKIKGAKEFSHEKDSLQQEEYDKEIDFYNKNYKALGLNEEKKRAKILEIQDKKLKDHEKFIKDKEDYDNKDIKAKDDLDVLQAKGDEAKLQATLKKLKDEKDFKLKNEKLTTNEKLVIQAQYLIDVDKLYSDDDAKKYKKNIEADQEDINNIKKEEELDKKTITNKGELASALIKLVEERKNAELKFEQDKYDELIKLAEKNGEDTTSIIKAHNEKVKELNTEGTASEIALSKAVKESKLDDMNAIGNASESLSKLFGEQTAAAKVLSVASAIINTYTGATKALAEGGIVGIAGAAAVIATGLVSVQKIISTPVPNSKGSSSGSSQAVTKFQAPQMFGLGGEKISNPSQYANQRVYVTESDISKSQIRVKTIQQSSILGH